MRRSASSKLTSPLCSICVCFGAARPARSSRSRAALTAALMSLWSSALECVDRRIDQRGDPVLVERFTRIDADTIDYRFTVTDPTMDTKPWTASIPMSRTEDVLFEYACHEGNYALGNILAGARSDEKRSAEAAQEAPK